MKRALLIVLVISLVGNVASGVAWYSVNHHAEDVLDECMAVVRQCQDVAASCETALGKVGEAMSDFKSIAESCVETLGKTAAVDQ